jgi:hypothetical protein
MDAQLTLMVGTWSVFAAALLGVMLYRKNVARHEDDFLHVMHATARLLNDQATTAQQLDVLDRRVKILAGFVLLYGLTIIGFYLYEVWQASLRMTS